MAKTTSRVAPKISSVRLKRAKKIPAKAMGWRLVTPAGKVFKAIRTARFKVGSSSFVVVRVLPRPI
jgi:hypothetical protein